MSTPAISARNRTNARNSTGPKSAAGKTRASRNAMRHGATSKPSDEDVLRWLAIILDRPQLDPRDLDPDLPGTRPSLDLAYAEARRALAVRALRDFEAGAAEPSEQLLADRGYHETLRDLWRIGETDRALRRLAERIARPVLDRIADETRIGGKRHRLLQRYANEAKAKRDAAFSAWIGVFRQDTAIPETKPKTI